MLYEGCYTRMAPFRLASYFSRITSCVDAVSVSGYRTSKVEAYRGILVPS